MISVTAIVVTYNRPALLARALDAIEAQTIPPSQLLVIDNGSGPETADVLQHFQGRTSMPTTVTRSDANLGGAGGFALGLQSIDVADGHWVWVMDDDAEPTESCLERLTELINDKENIMAGPAAVGHPPDHNILCWPASKQDGSTVRHLTDMPSSPLPVKSLPFLGLLLPSTAINCIGLPESRLFISGDDIDFTMRARKAGYTLYLQPTAVLRHPLPVLQPIGLLHRRIWLQRIPAWKRYFEVRNRLWVARRHYGIVPQLGVLCVTLLRFAFTMIQMPDRLQQARAYLHGITDGMLGRLDRRPLGP
ncbi:glycosyltransferase [Ottowia caeni]|uniref:glycosyltransferase n=1 Tax=Ottowia caeni TaxID=2870339 RepID=UPI001E601230|nr:glycosyltransferase [Ottowia caeni]